MDKDKQHSLELEHRFDAPPQEVFAAWTNPTEIVRWWGPKEFRTTSFDADVREGGESRAVMVGEDDVTPSFPPAGIRAWPRCCA